MKHENVKQPKKFKYGMSKSDSNVGKFTKAIEKHKSITAFHKKQRNKATTSDF